MYAKVAVFRPLNHTFEYLVPKYMEEELKVCSLCSVPFHNSLERALVLEVSSEREFEGELEELDSILATKAINPNLINLAQYLSKIYITPLGTVLKTMVPASFPSKSRKGGEGLYLNIDISAALSKLGNLKNRAPKQYEVLQYLLSVDAAASTDLIRREVGCSRSPIDSLKKKGLIATKRGEGRDFSFPSEIAAVRDVDRIEFPLPGHFEIISVAGNLESRLEGYLGSIRQNPEQGAILMIVPDTYRAEELYSWLHQKTSSSSSTYHSDLKPGQQAERWEEILRGELSALVGVRQAIFAPFPNLRAIIVDQEAHGFYRSGSRQPEFNLIDTAIRRGKNEDVPVVVGDTIPSLRSYHGVQTSRSEGRWKSPISSSDRKPSLQIKDLKGTAPGRLVSPELTGSISDRLSREEGVILCGQQSGFTTKVICSSCGEIVRCPECGAPVVYQETRGLAVCGNCKKPNKLTQCAECEGEDFRFLPGGMGRAEAEIAKRFSGAQVRVVEKKKITPKKYFQLLLALNRGDIDVLIGTETVLSFFLGERVTLIGLLNLDLQLNMADYRSGEQVLTTLCRCLDKLGQNGELFVQTYNPRHPAIRSAKSGDWQVYYEKELPDRADLNYPPFSKILFLTTFGNTKREAFDCAREIKKLLNRDGEDLRVIGPRDKIPSQLRDKRSAELLVKTTDPQEAAHLIAAYRGENSPCKFRVELDY